MSDTNDILDDPRLTAFALGELDGADRAEIEALLAKDENARRAVEEIRATANVVAAELGGEPMLTETQRAAIAAAATQADGRRRGFRMPRVFRISGPASVAAATIIVAATGGALGMYYEQRVNAAKAAREREVADTHGDGFVGSGMTGGGGGGGGGTTAGTRPGSGRYDSFADDAGDAAPAKPAEPSAPTPPPRPPSGAVKAGGTGGFAAGKDQSATPAQFREAGGAGGHAVAPGLTRGGKVRIVDATKPPVTLKALAFQLDGTISADSPVAADQLKRLETLGYIGGDLTVTTASYSHIEDNPFRLVKDAPLSTFGTDVDTASYANVRRMLNEGRLPPPGAVRIEEMVNYFPYDYAPPTDGAPFAVRVDVAGCPWKTDHRLVRIGMKGKIVATAARPAANLVLLLDVSGSMNSPERLPLIVQSMKMLVETLTPRDRVAIVTYAGESGLALPSTSCEDKGKILAALDALTAGGSTNGAAGIQLAYDTAMANKIDGGVNRVILATDGDFNVGVSDESSLVKLIEEKAKSGVSLSALGVGTDNFKDAQMEKLADHGHGNYAYIDSLKEGKKALVDQVNGTLVTIAKDAKIQVEFNPAQVGAWRLVGYEDRLLAAEDFRNDQKMGGDVGAGHTVTALYEVVPLGALTESVGVEPLKYQQPPAPSGVASREMLTVKLRWKAPDSDVSTPMEVPLVDEGATYSAASPDFKFAASVAAFGLCLRGSPNRGNANIDAILELAVEGAANDPGGLRAEFVELVKKAKALGAK